LLPILLAFLSKFEYGLFNLSIVFDPSLISFALEEFVLEWGEIGHAGLRCLILRSTYCGAKGFVASGVSLEDWLLPVLTWKACVASGVSLEDLFCFRR
jgi:hypothetical protein